MRQFWPVFVSPKGAHEMSNSTLTHHAAIQEMPALRVLSIRMRTPLQALPQRIQEAYGAIGAYLHELGIKPAGPPFVVYYNDNMDDLDIEAGAPVTEALPGRGDIQSGTIPAATAATCLHVGPYPELHRTYRALMDWMQAHGHHGTGVCYEYYLNDPDEVVPEALETQIVMPLQAA
jgi:effector-binding domain-containing protein